MSLTLDELYSYYDIINDDKNEETKRLDAYKLILKGLSGDDKAKRLSSQFVARFFKQFPDFKEEAFSKFLDLFDDESVDTRKQAINDLRIIGRHCKDYIPRISGVYSQLLLNDDNSEYLIVSQALSEFFLSDPKPILTIIFSQMVDDGSENSRVGIFKFLQENLKKLPDSMVTEELECFIQQNLQKLFQDVSEIEFIPLISVLSSLKSMSTVIGRQKLVDMITDQALQDVPDFQIDDISSVAEIRECSKQISLYISKNVHAEKMFCYLIEKVMPELLGAKTVDPNDTVSLWQAIAALSKHSGPKWTPTSEMVDKCLENIFNKLDVILPKSCEISETKEAKVDYTLMESILYVMMNIGKQSTPDKFTTEKWLAIKPRLQILGRLAQDYQHTIKVDTSKNENLDLKTKHLIQKTMTNILDMVKDLYKNPVSFKVCDELVLSWQVANDSQNHKQNNNNPGDKRNVVEKKPQESNFKRNRNNFNGNNRGRKFSNRRF